MADVGSSGDGRDGRDRRGDDSRSRKTLDQLRFRDIANKSVDRVRDKEDELLSSYTILRRDLGDALNDELTVLNTWQRSTERHAPVLRQMNEANETHRRLLQINSESENNYNTESHSLRNRFQSRGFLAKAKHHFSGNTLRNWEEVIDRYKGVVDNIIIEQTQEWETMVQRHAQERSLYTDARTLYEESLEEAPQQEHSISTGARTLYEEPPVNFRNELQENNEHT